CLCFHSFVFLFLFFFLMLRPPPGSTLFPYTTLFRSICMCRLIGRMLRCASCFRWSVDHSRENQPIIADQGWFQWHPPRERLRPSDRKSTRLNSSHVKISYAVFCLKKKTKK